MNGMMDGWMDECVSSVLFHGERPIFREGACSLWYTNDVLRYCVHLLPVFSFTIYGDYVM